MEPSDGGVQIHESELISLPVYCCITCGAPSKYGTELTGRIHCYNCKLPNEKALTKYTLCYNCNTRASYGIEPNKPLFCTTHKPEGYVNVQGRLCICGKSCTYGRRGVALSCRDCKQDDYVVVRNSKCKCGNILLYGPRGGDRISCKQCRDPDHVLIGINVCVVCELKRATWGPNESCLLTCRDCKSPGYMTRKTRRPKCEVCKRIAQYGLPGYEKTRCRSCRSDGYV